MNERVLVPTLPCILLLSTDYLSIVPRVLKPRKNKKGTKIRTKIRNSFRNFDRDREEGMISEKLQNQTSESNPIYTREPECERL